VAVLQGFPTLRRPLRRAVGALVPVHDSVRLASAGLGCAIQSHQGAASGY
jgi:hypothetical protein